MEMVKAYSIFANEGYKVSPHFIRKIEDMYGNTLYEYENYKEGSIRCLKCFEIRLRKTCEYAKVDFFIVVRNFNFQNGR